LKITTETTTLGLARPIKFGTDGLTRMTIEGSGNIGIGTQAPTAKLDVAGTIKASALSIAGDSAYGTVATFSYIGNAAATHRVALGINEDASISPRQGLTIVENFMGIIKIPARLIGTGASTSTVGDVAGMLSIRKAGILSVGTTSTGYAEYLERGAGSLTHFNLGSSSIAMEWVIGLPILSNGTDSFEVRVGLEANNLTQINDGIFFRYTHSVNTGKWEAVCRASGNETSIDTGITANAGAWQALKIIVNSAGTTASFYIDGLLVASISTNLPTKTGYAFGIKKIAGTTNVNLYVNFFKLTQLYNIALTP
jgi:hypothetical protein